MPHLTEIWTDAGAALHKTQGALYWVSNPQFTNALDHEIEGQVLMLRDSDVDGTIDDWSIIRDGSDTYSLKTNYVPGTTRR